MNAMNDTINVRLQSPALGETVHGMLIVGSSEVLVETSSLSLKSGVIIPPATKIAPALISATIKAKEGETYYCEIALEPEKFHFLNRLTDMLIAKINGIGGFDLMETKVLFHQTILAFFPMVLVCNMPVILAIGLTALNCTILQRVQHRMLRLFILIAIDVVLVMPIFALFILSLFRD